MLRIRSRLTLVYKGNAQPYERTISKKWFDKKGDTKKCKN